MRTLKQIREEISNKIAEVEAIQGAAAAENRELSIEEAARVDAVMGKGDAGGELAELRTLEARAVKREQLQAEFLARTNSAPPPADAIGTQQQKPRIEIASSVVRPPVMSLGRGLQNRSEQEELCYGFGRVAMAALFNHESSLQWCKDRGIAIRNAMTEGFDSKGGVLVPEQYEMEIIRLINDYGVARREFGYKPMTSDTLNIPRRTGGLTAYYPGEGGTITASDPTYDNQKLTAKKLAVLGRFSSEVNEDAMIAIGNELGVEAALAIATAQDNAAFVGDGTSTYGRIVGIKNALTTGSEYTAATGNTSFGTLDLEDFEGMLGLVQSYAFKFGNAKWYIHRAGWAASMQRLAAAAGGNTVGDIVNGVPQQMFLGYPVVFVEVMNNTLTAQTSTEGLCFFGDLRQCAAFGERRGMAMAVSNDVYFTTDETAIRWTTRFDVNVHDKGATGGASGGIVQLLTPGS